MAWEFEALHKSLGFPKRNRPVLDPAASVSKTTGGGAVANHQGIGTHAGKGIRDGFLQRVNGGQNAHQGGDSNPDNTRGKGGPKAITPTAFRAILRLSVHPREVVAVLIIETMFHGPNIGPARPLSLISPTHKL